MGRDIKGRVGNRDIGRGDLLAEDVGDLARRAFFNRNMRAGGAGQVDRGGRRRNIEGQRRTAEV